MDGKTRAYSSIVSSSSTGNRGTSAERTDLWADILKKADRGGRSRTSQKRKNVILLSERHRGRSHLLQQLLKRSSNAAGPSKKTILPALAVGYEILETKDDGDEESTPPISVFYPPSSHPTFMKLLPKSLPSNALPDTAVVILLDWSKPSEMIHELLTWLHWIDGWASTAGTLAETDEMRERLQSLIQHYTEPSSSSSSTLPSLSSYAGAPLLPLGPGCLTLNQHGVPIIVVCTRADLMDTTGEEAGMKGQWEERTDWVQQVLRTICLAYGAALFYTAPTQPTTYTLLRQYLVHRLYTNSPSLKSPSDSAPPPTSLQFPFNHRANVLDRDAVMVPTGWDSHGKINVLRDRFDPARVLKAWEAGIRAFGTDAEVEEETVEDLWMEMIPDTSRPKPNAATGGTTTVEPEQTFLSRQLEILHKDPNRDPRASFRQAAAAVSASSLSQQDQGAAAGVVGPMGAGGLNLPGVEKVMAEMEGGSAEEMKEKFARLGRREISGRGPTTGPPSSSESGSRGAMPNEALHNFFQGLLATKGKSASGTKPTTAAKAAGEEE